MAFYGAPVGPFWNNAGDVTTVEAVIQSRSILNVEVAPVAVASITDKKMLSNVRWPPEQKGWISPGSAQAHIRRVT